MILGVLKRFGQKSASLAIAVGIWVFVSSEPQISTFVSAPVQFRGLPETLEISSDPIESVTLELRGASGELRLWNGESAAVILDVSKVQPGERTFLVDAEDVTLPRGVRLERAIPSQLRLEFERRATRAVPVQVRFGKLPREGYEVAGYEVKPSKVEVVGPESRVVKVEAAITDPLDVSALVGTQELRVNTFVPDSQVRLRSKAQVAVKVMIRKR